MSARRPGDPIEQEIVIAASPEAVFAAWSDPESMRIWMCPEQTMDPASVELDFHVGGGFRIVMHGREGDYEQTGEYLEIDPPHRIVFTWVSSFMPEDERETRVTVSIEDVGDGRTRLRLRHDRLPPSDRYDGHVEGWAEILRKLSQRFEGRIRGGTT